MEPKNTPKPEETEEVHEPGTQQSGSDGPSPAPVKQTDDDDDDDEPEQ